MGELECQFYVIGTDNFVVWSLPHRTVILYCLVHHVPSFHLAFEMLYHVGDMMIHAVYEHSTAHGAAIVVFEHPPWWL